MKRKHYLAGLLACLLCISLLGCNADTFDAEKDGILKLIIYDEDAEELCYDIIGTKGRRMETEEFESAALTILSADPGCFQFSVRDGKVSNEVVSVELYDETGSLVVPDAITTAILMQTAAIQDNAILSLDIIMCGDRYFPVVELNVNLHTPTILYYFNTETQTMTELCRYSNTVIGGMQLLDPEKLP